MSGLRALSLSELPVGGKKAVEVSDQKILLVRLPDEGGVAQVFAVEAACPHAGAPLDQGALCRGHLICPWHGGTFALATGAVLEPPPLRALKRYAVSIEAVEVLVDPTPVAADVLTPIGKDKHFVCAGAGAATAAAVSHLREIGFAGRLTVIDPHAEEPIDRTVLTKMALSGEKPLAEIGLLQPEEEAGLKLERIRASVKALTVAERKVTLNTGAGVAYDALLLATGGKPKRPDIPGADAENVFTIRHRADLERMEPLLLPGARAVILGDSFIALEAASALTQRKLKVTVVSRAELPFAKQFGEEVAETLLKLHRDHGVEVLGGKEMVAIEASGALLKSGESVAFDLLLLAVGVAPVTDFAPSLAHADDGGFAVGKDLKVADGAWAAGDIATVDGLRIEHWRVAQQHGRVAAEAMLASLGEGQSTPYGGIPYFWTYHFGKRLNYIGHALEWDSIEVLGEVADFKFIAFYLKNGLIVAALQCGMETAFAALVEPMCSPLTVADARREIAGL